jgi:hypothetical protein
MARATKKVFDSVVEVAFQIIFRAEMHANDFFKKKKLFLTSAHQNNLKHTKHTPIRTLFCRQRLFFSFSFFPHFSSVVAPYHLIFRGGILNFHFFFYLIFVPLLIVL